MKNFTILCLSILAFALASCGASDDPNAEMNTQFAVDVADSTHVLSPRTYSYLQNYSLPLGIKAAVVTTNSIDDAEMGRYADNLFDQYCEKQYSGNTFRQRGVLIVVSESPQLIQVRVGKTYAVYCRMHGSAAGESYLNMQKQVADRGLDEMCPIALNNVMKDIEDCRHLSWYQKVALTLSFARVEQLMDDLATPSESLFNRFYFRPFQFLLGGLRVLSGSWMMAFLILALGYTLLKNYVEDKLKAFVMKKAKQDSKSEQDYSDNLEVYGLMLNAGLFVVKLLLTIPTLAAISVLSTSRTEDVIALQYAHIPSVDVIGSTMQWTNEAPGLGMVLMLMCIYYLKFLLCDNGMFSVAHCSDRKQQQLISNNAARVMCDQIINLGYNRYVISKIIKLLFSVLTVLPFVHNVHEYNHDANNYDPNDPNDDGKPKKRLIDFCFYDSDSDFYRQSPLLAIMVNTHREALWLTAFLGIAAIMLFSYPYVIYFLVLWIVQFAIRAIQEVRYVMKQKGLSDDMQPMRLFDQVWLTNLIFAISMGVLLAILAPSYQVKAMDKVEEVAKALPDDFSGLYFVPKANGADVKGTTARILQTPDGGYYMQVYSDKPMRRFELTLDREKGIFHCDVLGDGYITYDEQTKSLRINFSDLWILTN